ncbi:MAG TPA: hypothetical protein VFV94_07455 [Polyangiaceae bacterium]|nr:hypothetical protein [Polyangiaceae bacterium]
MAQHIPIACNPRVFTKEELEAHVALGMDLLFRRPDAMHEVSEGFVFDYVGKETLLLELARFAYDEHRCCPWASFKLEMEPFAEGTGGRLRLHYMGGAEGKALLAEAITKLRGAASNPAREAQLKAAIGASSRITTDNKDDFYARAGSD